MRHALIFRNPFLFQQPSTHQQQPHKFHQSCIRDQLCNLVFSPHNSLPIKTLHPLQSIIDSSIQITLNFSHYSLFLLSTKPSFRLFFKIFETELSSTILHPSFPPICNNSLSKVHCLHIQMPILNNFPSSIFIAPCLFALLTSQEQLRF